ncbi:MAG: diguanylate cyclase [Pseudomonadota bacterium]|nr:diguanylate cyclase [Pseudomonadota bacterium]
MLNDPEIDQQHREFARKMLLAYSLLAVLLLPIYQVLDLMWTDGIPSLWWSNAAWRALAVITALFGLLCVFRRQDGQGAPLMLRLLVMNVMLMMFGLFISNYFAPDGNVTLMVNGLIIIIFAAAPACLRGARELLLIFGVPFIATLLLMGWLDQSFRDSSYVLYNVVTSLIIALIISELLFRTRTALFEQQVELRKSAATDPLTGMNNRRFVEPQLHSEIARARRYNKTFSVVMADLDRFKRVNDDHGHNVGDAVLRLLAIRISDTIRDEDRAVRWGGEEFLILMPEINAEQALLAAERIRRAVSARPFEIDGLSLSITISLGVAEYAGEENPESLIARADKNLYRAKDEGRNRVCADPS